MNSLHPPKLISSLTGLGFNTTKRMHLLSEIIGIGTEVWNELEKPWRQDETVIAESGYTWITKWEAGKPYIINKFYNTEGKLVGIYCDIAWPVRRIEGGFEFDDLYLDVWQVPGQAPIVLDEDELQMAVDAGYVSQDEAGKAKRTTEYLVDQLQHNPSILEFEKVQ